MQTRVWGSHNVVDQAFLPFQLEASLLALFLCAIPLCEAISDSEWGWAAFLAFSTTAVAFSSFSPRGSFPHLIAVVVRLLISGSVSYFSISSPPETWDREHKAARWIMIDPLVWVVELALFFNLDHPIYPIIWSVRRTTLAGALLTCSLGKKLSKLGLARHCCLSMAVIMIVHIILNLSEEDQYVTLGSIILLSINHLLGNNTKKNADEVFQEHFMGSFLIATLYRAFKRK